MLSSIIVIATWLFTFERLNARALKNGIETWGLSFCIAVSILYLFTFAQLNFIQGIIWLKVVVGIEISVALFYLLLKMKSHDLFALIFEPFRGQSRFFLTLGLIGLSSLIVFSVSTAAPADFDTNVYNIARIPAMISKGSTALGLDTASARQALFPLAHDLLYYPDIVYGNTRGLPLIGNIELLILSGVMLTQSKFILQGIARTNKNSAASNSKLIGCIQLILLAGCTVQVFQSLISKNDLIITILFCISISLALQTREHKECQFIDIFNVFAMLFLAVLAINIKAYGLILLIPILLLALSKKIGFWLNQKRKIEGSRMRCLWAIVIISTLLLITHGYQNHILEAKWGETYRATSVTTAWTNTQGALIDKAKNSAINTQRILFRTALAPYTDLSFYEFIGLKDLPRIPDSIIPEWLQGSNASAAGKFTLHRTNIPSRGSLLITAQVGIIIGMIGWLRYPLCKRKDIAFFVLLSSCLSLILFGSALLYQTWLSRFLGTIYIPLLPTASVGITALLTNNFRSYEFLKSGKIWLLKLASIYLVAAPLLFAVWKSDYIADGQLPQNPEFYYKRYLMNHQGLSKDEVENFLTKLRSPFHKRTLCGFDGRWYLIPFLITQRMLDGNNKFKVKSFSRCDFQTHHLFPRTVMSGEKKVLGKKDWIGLP
tara:strand:- start:485 stop:2464 length:1980 start_codon:yes stop_codon:yes gene_type:complete